MFLLGIQTTYKLFATYNTGTQNATADVLDSLWTYLVRHHHAPSPRALQSSARSLTSRTQRPALRLAGVALALLSVAALWKLVLAMVA